jgi:predicted XRE-type DNA-binding protein
MAKSQLSLRVRLEAAIHRRVCRLIDSQGASTVLLGVHQSSLTSVMRGDWRATSLAHLQNFAVAPGAETSTIAIVEPAVELALKPINLAVA